MNERLSSILVPIYKMFPYFALVALLASIPNWISISFSKDYLGGFAFLLIWGGIFYFVTSRWNFVHLRNDVIVASDFFRTAVIPISQVTYVKASSWWGWQPRTITIGLKEQTKFGDKIVFVPRGMGYSASTSAERLKKLFKLEVSS